METIPPEPSTHDSIRILPKALENACTTSSDLTINVRSVQVCSTLDQQSVHIRTPPRFRCGEARCACSCHLGRYLKSPSFLKAFFGSLSFRGTCSNHASNLWELKYWIPEWISNYNVYLLFEKNSCGSPSLGLRFPRKVPWGGQDTIIRFSLLGDVSGIRSILERGQGSLHDVDPNHSRTALHVSSTLIPSSVHKKVVLRRRQVRRFKESNRIMQASSTGWRRQVR